MTQNLTILFDLDGTIVNTAPDLMAAHNHVMKKFGYPTKSTDEIRNLAGQGAGAGSGSAAARRAVPGAHRRAVRKCHRHRYLQVSEFDSPGRQYVFYEFDN